MNNERLCAEDMNRVIFVTLLGVVCEGCFAGGSSKGEEEEKQKKEEEKREAGLRAAREEKSWI